LRGARSADLIERIQAAVLAAASERGSKHLRRLAELRRAQVVDRAAEVGVVEDVEKIRPRLKSETLAEFELPAQRLKCGGRNVAGRVRWYLRLRITAGPRWPRRFRAASGVRRLRPIADIGHRRVR
jgi:hypothetical protein